jgi:hypothetical protein
LCLVRASSVSSDDIVQRDRDVLVDRLCTVTGAGVSVAPSLNRASNHRERNGCRTCPTRDTRRHRATLAKAADDESGEAKEDLSSRSAQCKDDKAQKLQMRTCGGSRASKSV